MSKPNSEPIDITNATIAEIYGKQVADLIKFFSKLSDSAKLYLMDYVKWMSETDYYKKAIMIRIPENQEKHQK